MDSGDVEDEVVDKGDVRKWVDKCGVGGKWVVRDDVRRGGGWIEVM